MICNTNTHLELQTPHSILQKPKTTTLLKERSSWVISFSHFLPEIELMPEKRALDALDFLGQRIRVIFANGFFVWPKKAFPPYIYIHISVEVGFYVLEDLR